MVLMNTETTDTEALASAIAPLVHLNGDSKATLARNWSNFRKTLGIALEAAPEIHGRNYYAKTDGDHGTKAREAMDPYLSAIRELYNIAQGVELKIDNQ